MRPFRGAGESMSNVQRIRHELPVSLEIVDAVVALDLAVARAIDAAKEAGLPQGLVVGILHGHAHGETAKMVNKAQ
jgi:hydrogenase/urease accessory protein HupE